MTQWYHRTKIIPASVIAAALVMPFSAAAADLSGRVTDATGEIPLRGALIVIDELDRQVTTDRRGRYRMTNVPAGEYTVRVEFLGTPARVETVQIGQADAELDVVLGDDVARLENVLVVGQAAGQAAALNRQRAADNIVNIVSSDAIGQFPDQNVSEALQRLPGIAITRDQGEGRFIVIRGIDPSLNAVTINGARVPSAEAADRALALDVIPADIVQSLEVTKSLRPDQDADAIGGTIEVKSLSAFDRGGLSANARAEGSYNDLREEWSPKLSGAISNVFNDTLGVAAAVSWFDRKFGTDNLETDGGWPVADGPDGQEFRAPREGEQRHYTITRERLGLTLNLDLVPDANNSFYLRSLWSDFDDFEQRLRNENKFHKGDVVDLGPDFGVWEDAEVQKEVKTRHEAQSITSIAAGGEHLLDRWDIDYQLAYSRSEEDEPGRIDGTFEGDFDLQHRRLSRELYEIIGGEGWTDPTRYELDKIEYSSNTTSDREWSAAANFRHGLLFGGNPGDVKFGFKTRFRDKESDVNTIVYDDFGGDFTLNDFLFGNIDYGLGTFGPAVDEHAFRRFVEANRATFEVDEDDTNLLSIAADYGVNEDVYAAYGMANADIGRVRIMGGVRVEHTEFSSRGVQASIDEENGDGTPTFRQINAKRNYTDVLPGLHFRVEQNAQSIWRAAITTAVVRPNFNEVAPRQLIEIEEDDDEFERKAEAGNPDLDPLRAVNLDLSFEYYPGGLSLISAGAFYKRLEDFIVLADVAGTAPWENFDEVIQPINGETADLFGIELAYTKQFDNGLLIGANYTYTDADAHLPFRSETIPLPRQSEHIGNLSIGYERGGLSLRAAMTYRSEYLDTIEDLEDAAFDTYADDHIQVDLSAKYRFADNWQVYAEAININNEPLYRYFGSSLYNAQYDEYGWTAQIGFRWFH